MRTHLDVNLNHHSTLHISPRLIGDRPVLPSISKGCAAVKTFDLRISLRELRGGQSDWNMSAIDSAIVPLPISFDFGRGPWGPRTSA
jgi:hypothetical protein